MKKTLQQSAFFPYQQPAQEMFILEDAPCEKVSIRGAAALTNSEVLAAIIGANSAASLVLAKTIMTKYDNSFTNMAKVSLAELQQIQGVTRLIAARIACVFEMNRRRANESNYKIVAKTSGELAQMFKNLIGSEPVEYFYVAYLNRAKKIIKVECISKGGMTGTVADPRVILKLALELNATDIVLSHNHPSGSLKPSRADEEITTRIKQAAMYLDIKVVDHIIVSDEGYFSFADEGLI